MTEIDFQKIEEKWQERWSSSRIFEVEPDEKEKFFIIFAYPGVSGYLHVGHMRGFSYADAISRYKKMRGFNVLFPVGTHATGNVAIGFAKKVEKNDPKWTDYLKRNGCPEGKIRGLVKPEKVVEFFNNVYINDYWKRFGFSSDYRRFTTTINPDYNKFIEWQFLKLKEKGLLVQMPYFAPACVEHGPVAIDPSETDISKGGHAEKLEYTLLKFRFGEYFILAATLRPETVYGQTNLWVDPDVEYVKVIVNNEKWIVSRECAEKLPYQGYETKTEGRIRGKELIGKTVTAPQIHKEIPILQCRFCDADIGSGIVTSVPSDAPFDWIALSDLKKAGNESAKNIEPIAIIKSTGYGEHPAIEICEKMGIQNQEDKEKLEEATKSIYKSGFHTGVMRDNCGIYSGMKVAEAEEKIRNEMIKNGEAAVFYDLSEEVICRCGQKVIIKEIPDQWFIRYSDEELTRKSQDWAKKMDIRPDDYKQNIGDVLAWFKERACVRLGNWLGTRLPFDSKWIIEPISDSTLYPMFYIISKYSNAGEIKPDEMDESFFDYIALGKGEPKKEIYKRIKEDLEYWYPLDMNLGGKEHKTVHFPPFIMNHVGLLPEKFWPKGIFVNWWVVGEGGKISKSKGGAEPIPDAAKVYTVDGMRLYYCHIGSPHSDIIWSPDTVLKYRKHVISFYYLMFKAIDDKSKGEDEWLLSRINKRVKEATEHADNYDIRKAIDTALFGSMEDMRWHFNRSEKGCKKSVELILKMLCPVMPHTCEELWERLGKKEFLSTSEWPSFDGKLTKDNLEIGEDLVRKIVEDIEHIIDIVGKKPEKIKIIVPAEWKYIFFDNKDRNISEMPDELKKYGKIISKFDRKKIPGRFLNREDERVMIKSAKDFLKKLFAAEVSAEDEEESKEEKAGKSWPMKPSIIIE